MRTYFCECGGKVEVINNVVGECKCGKVFGVGNSKISNGAEDFHSDVSCDTEPPLGTMLQLHILPESGGDTMFANMYMAYDALSNPMRRRYLQTLFLEKSWKKQILN